MSLLEYYDDNNPGDGRVYARRSRDWSKFQTAVIGLIIDLIMKALKADSLRDLCAKLDDQFGSVASEEPVAAASGEPTKKKASTKKKSD